ncbi:MAG: methyltransferase domain-containing protein, partial [Candidatus Aenigmarchaeota archaeon]|nr:methyltransferase domain-containing protein [Candidatus Aenigmarchaeota archaeon]
FVGRVKISQNFESIKKIINFLRKNIPERLINAKSFRVTCSRYGYHNFRSIDVERLVGEYLYENYKIPVSLKDFEKNLFIKIVGSNAYILLQLNKTPLDKRFYKLFNHPTAIDPILAYGMIRLSKIKRNQIIVDPMCGSGTILIEAALEFPNAKYFGLDIFERFVKGARMNAKAAKVRLIKFKVGDCRCLEKYFSKIDRIITNPPYGVKIGREETVKALYFKFVESAARVIDKGRIVLTVLKAGVFRNIIFKTKFFRISEERVVRYGGLYPNLFVLERI